MTNIKTTGKELYQVYRNSHEQGYPITKEDINNMHHEEENALRSEFMEERKKYENDSVAGHVETWWAMLDELQ